MAKSDFEILSYSRLIDEDKFREYTTGIHTMDTFLFEELKEIENENLTGMSVAYFKNKIIGMFALSAAQTRAVKVDQSADMFGKINEKYDSIPLISIDHFSVNKKYQFDGAKEPEDQFRMGTLLMQVLFGKVVELRRVHNVGIAGITVEALDSAADWYIKQGFSFLDEHEENAIKHKYKMVCGYKFIEDTFVEFSNYQKEVDD